MIDDVVSLAEISQMTGLSISTVYSYHSRGKLPMPDRRLEIGPLWKRSTIDAWAVRTVRGYKGADTDDRGSQA